MVQHLLRIQNLSETEITQLLDRAQEHLSSGMSQQGLLDTLSGKVLVNLFFEPSTRTRQSFTISAQRLGAIVLNPSMENSSTVKGESLKDTLKTYIAMGCQFFIVRHAQNYFVEQMLTLIDDCPIAIVNAGDGSHQHPTQTLLDLLTIRQHKPNFNTLRIAIIGDIAHSRVAGSLILGLKLMGVNEIHLVAPLNFLPDNVADLPVRVFSDIEQGIAAADVIVTLRVQRERMLQAELPNLVSFHQQYGITMQRLQYAKPDAIVMHPGPINRDIEIAAEVADGPHSVILQQVQNGIAMRMALLEWLNQFI